MTERVPFPNPDKKEAKIDGLRDVPSQQESDDMSVDFSSLMCPTAIAEDQDVGPDNAPKGTYHARVICDNCLMGVVLVVAHSIAVPDECPDLACPYCRVKGYLYKPLGEKEMVRAMRQRLEGGEGPLPGLPS